jgi:hypothetical protein
MPRDGRSHPVDFRDVQSKPYDHRSSAPYRARRRNCRAHKKGVAARLYL